MSETVNTQMSPDQKPSRGGWKRAAVSAGLAAVTAVAAFNEATGLAIAGGMATGIALPGRRVGWRYALTSAGLAGLTTVAVFNDATGMAIAAGIATGISLPVTAYMLFAEGMSG